MSSGTVRANGIEIAYETFGSPDDPALVLVMGLGMQMLAWRDGLCAALAARGLYVIRFDNRDVGLSTHLDGVPTPTYLDVLLLGRKPPYSVEDMAEDTVGLLDGLGLDRVHLVGVSLGGFIAQTVAMNHPERLASLTLIMTSTGSRIVGTPKLRAYWRLLSRRVAADRAGAHDSMLEVMEIIGSRGFAFDDADFTDYFNASYDRSYDFDGYLRQLAAVGAQPNRSEGLRDVTVPSLVIHGLADPLVAPSGGRALSRLLPNSKFVGYVGMGHDMPKDLWPAMVDEIAELVDRRW